MIGFEPRTSGVLSHRSTNWAKPLRWLTIVYPRLDTDFELFNSESR